MFSFFIASYLVVFRLHKSSTWNGGKEVEEHVRKEKAMRDGT